MSEYDNGDEIEEGKGRLQRVKEYLEEKKEDFDPKETARNLKDYALERKERTKDYFKDEKGRLNLVKIGEPLRYVGAGGTGVQGVRSAYIGTEDFINETLDELYKTAQELNFQEFQEEGAIKMYEAFDNFKETINANIKWPFFAYGVGEALNAAHRLRTEDLSGTEKLASALKSAPVTTPAIAQATDDNLMFSTFVPAGCVIAGYAIDYLSDSEADFEEIEEVRE